MTGPVTSPATDTDADTGADADIRTDIAAGGDPAAPRPVGTPGDGQRPPDRGPALRITRGVRRALLDRGMRSLVEFPLANGRRADVVGLDEAGTIVIVEVKSGPADYLSDQKWPEYRDFCDRFYFAVAPDFPQQMIPEDCGLMVADEYGAEVLREAPLHKLPAPRRKAVTQRIALTACARLHRLEDPGLGM